LLLLKIRELEYRFHEKDGTSLVVVLSVNFNNFWIMKSVGWRVVDNGGSASIFRLGSSFLDLCHVSFHQWYNTTPEIGHAVHVCYALRQHRRKALAVASDAQGHGTSDITMVKKNGKEPVQLVLTVT